MVWVNVSPRTLELIFYLIFAQNSSNNSYYVDEKNYSWFHSTHKLHVRQASDGWWRHQLDAGRLPEGFP